MNSRLKRLLLTRSRHDVGNQYLYAYSEELLREAEEHSWKADKAEDAKNNAKEVRSRLEKNKPALVIFNGHGSDETICGYNDEVLIDVASASLLEDAVVFARSCDALNKLGKIAVDENGCKAFVGYADEFVIPHVH